MFCKNCGAQIEENSKFCSACRKPVTVEQAVTENHEKHTIRRFGANSTLKKFVFMYYGLGVLFFVLEVVLIIANIDAIEIWLDYGLSWAIDTVSILEIMLLPIMCISVFLCGKSWSMRNVCVCTDKVTGNAAMGVLSRPFGVSYSDIISVTYNVQKRGVVIETAIGTFNCYQIESPKECADLIQGRLEK